MKLTIQSIGLLEYNKYLKNYILLFIVNVTFSFSSCGLGSLDKTPENRIFIEEFIAIDSDKKVNSSFTPNAKLKYSSFYNIEPVFPVNTIEGDLVNGKANYTLYSNDQLLMYPEYSLALMVFPGDSICIKYVDSFPLFSGNDSVKCKLLNELNSIDHNLKRPTPNSITIRSLDDYLKWNKYVDIKLSLQLPLLESYKGKLQQLVFDYYKTAIISIAENYRVNAFGALRNLYQEKNPVFPSATLETLWDTTQYKFSSTWLRSLSIYNGPIQNVFGFVRLEVWRKYGFNLKNDSLSSKDLRTFLYYTNVKQKYKGLLRERLMAHIIGDQAIKGIGLRNHITKSLLKDYYSQVGYQEFKKWVQEIEKKEKNNY